MTVQQLTLQTAWREVIQLSAPTTLQEMNADQLVCVEDMMRSIMGQMQRQLARFLGGMDQKTRVTYLDRVIGSPLPQSKVVGERISGLRAAIEGLAGTLMDLLEDKEASCVDELAGAKIHGDWNVPVG